MTLMNIMGISIMINQEKELISVVRRIYPSECPNCGKNTINIYDKFGRMINYSLLAKYNTVDQIYDKIIKSDLKYMKCSSCNKDFILDWTRSKIPYPSNKDKYKEFEYEENRRFKK